MPPQQFALTVLVFVPLAGGAPATKAADRTDTVARVSFRYDVLPALSKQGCSAGACHGSPGGKGGFRLSLRGFDPQLDERTLTREAFGRRVNQLAPEESLILMKPTMQAAHGGGKKLEKGDLAYRILRDWIADGCPVGPSDETHCERIAVSPSQGEYRWPANRRRLRVTAHFSDGSSHDVTPLTVFSSSDEKVATVDAEGLVVSQQRGQVTILARYLDFIATAELTFLKDVDGFAWQDPPVESEIDRIVFARLKKLQILPAPLCGDSEFIRRVYLDVLGVLPRRAEIEKFLRDQAPDKRDRLIDGLLERPEYAQYWGQRRADLLRVRASKVGAKGVHNFYEWLVASVADNTPYDQFATDLLTAQGSTLENPAANYYRAAADTNDCAETTSQLFLGIRIQCAKCHNHPFDQWSQDNYYGIGAFFNRVERKTVEGKDEMLIALRPDGEVTQPRTGETIKPWLPQSGVVDVEDGRDRREVFARWLTSPENPYFARVAVNRAWGGLFGRGIVEPVDDFNAGNPPSHPDLLDYLAEQFIASGYDQKQLLRKILKSRVYQLSSRTNEFNREDDQYFSHSHARMLSAEQVFDAICQVTGVPQQFAGLPEGTRATSLPSPDFGNQFLKTFGQPARNTVCQCERTNEPNLARTLQLINGELIPKKLRDHRSRIGRIFDNLPARLAAAGEPPAEGRVAWFKADAGVFSEKAAAADAAAVAHWKNQAGDRFHVIQNNADQRPRWIQTAIAGLPAIRFDGTNDVLHNVQETLLPAGSPRTVVLVARVADDTGGALFAFGRQRTGGAAIFAAQHITIGDKYYVYSDGVNAAGNTTVPSAGFSPLKDPFVTTFLSPGAGGKLRVRVGGSDLKTTQPGSIGRDQGSLGFTIGSREDLPLGSQMWNGDIAEVLIYDRELSNERTSAVGKYLATKYELNSSYPRAKVPVLAAANQDQLNEIITDFYFAAYCRPPSADELKTALDHIAATEDSRQALEDLVWALLNSKEFLFQH